jgi:hypothetical protein
LRLNPHYHQIALDGVYTEAEDEEVMPEFHPLPHLTSADVADLLQVARVRILRFLKRQGAIVETNPLELGEADGTEEGLLQLAAAAVTGQVPAGPELRQREPVVLQSSGEVRVTGALLASGGGFTLHAATVAAGRDAVGREALVRYALRPPLAQERLTRASNDLVRIALKRPFSDGTVAVELDPLSLLCRLATTVPPEIPVQCDSTHYDHVGSRHDHSRDSSEIRRGVRRSVVLRCARRSARDDPRPAADRAARVDRPAALRAADTACGTPRASGASCVAGACRLGRSQGKHGRSRGTWPLR